MENERYARQTMLAEIGLEGQEKLSKASVLIVGLGGLGAPVSTYLTGAGVGRIGLCDPDTVSLTNLQRQVLYTEETVGMPKVEIARARLQAMSGHTAFDVFPEGLTPENAADMFAGYDLVVDCTDNFVSRYLIDDTCAALGKPWIHGAIGEFYGQVAVMNAVAGCRYSDIYPDRERMCSRPRKVAGVLGTVPGVVGAIEASEAIKVLVGFGEPLDGKLLTINLLTLQSDILTIR